MACPGHTGGLGTERDVQVTDGDLGHGVCVHIPNLSTASRMLGIEFF